MQNLHFSICSSHLLFVALILLIKNIHCYACYPEGFSKTVSLGKETYVCVVIGRLDWLAANNNNSYIRIPSLVTADTVSSVAVKGAWTSSSYGQDDLIRRLSIENSQNDAVTISVESMGIMSFQKLYRQPTSNVTQALTFPLLMAVIYVDNGDVKSILWDDTCKWCDSNHCLSSTYDFEGNIEQSHSDGKSCFIPDTQCKLTTGSVRTANANAGTAINSLCDLNVFITWTGTDSEGKFLKSAGSRFSRISRDQLSYFTAEKQKVKSDTSTT